MRCYDLRRRPPLWTRCGLTRERHPEPGAISNRLRVPAGPEPTATFGETRGRFRRLGLLLQAMDTTARTGAAGAMT